MKTNRRDFIKTAGLATAGMVVVPSLTSCGTSGGNDAMPFKNTLDEVNKTRKQRFNMCGYAAPALGTVRIGFIGLGRRGPSSLRRLCLIEGVEIKAICDLEPDRLALGQKIISDAGLPPAREYGKTEDDWKNMCESDDIDLIYQVTPFDIHVPVSIAAMENGKHAAVEMPAATTIEDCWKLVETSERTRMHCVMLENCCYDFFELLTLNMFRHGVLGEPVHADASYLHSSIRNRQGELNFKPGYRGGAHRNWNLDIYRDGIGNTYPTHGLGPVAQIMNINRGDKFEFLVSVDSKDFELGEAFVELAKQDSYYEAFGTEPKFRGNMNTSILKTEMGRTIMLQYDISSPRPYSRTFVVSGTKGVVQKYPLPPRIAFGHDWITKEEYDKLSEQYTPELVRHIGSLAKKVGGHGGMDFIMDWRLIDCLRNGLPLDMDVYDAASWSAIMPLTAWSVANNSAPIKIPDFTCGSYKSNKPVDFSMEGGATTGVRVYKIDDKEAKKQQNV